MHINGPVLIAYDGSDDARFAIDEAARLVGGADAIVLYVRQPLESVAAHLEGHPALEEVRGIEAGAMDAAERLASEGAQYARRAGLIAVPRVATSFSAVAETIVSAADEVDASLIVLGSRGYRGLRSLLLGSVSHHVVHHARRPAIIVPSPALITRRDSEEKTATSAPPIAA